jgi:predicted nucleic acid-binding protein
MPMSVTKAFIDTNILLYMYSVDEPTKRKHAIIQVNNYDRFISTQVLTEFCGVSIRKLKMNSLQLEKAINAIYYNTSLVAVELDTIKFGLYIHEKYRFNYYDSLIIASALESKCEFLLTEDMNHGQIIEKQLTIRNIFMCNNP